MTYLTFRESRERRDIWDVRRGDVEIGTLSHLAFIQVFGTMLSQAEVQAIADFMLSKAVTR